MDNKKILKNIIDAKRKKPYTENKTINQLRKEKVPVSVYLVSGIKLQGEIESFDQFSILLKNNSV